MRSAPADGEHLLLAAGELAALVELALGKPRKELEDALGGPWPGPHEGNLHVLLDREVGEDASPLGHVAHAEARDPIGRPGRRHPAEDAHSALPRRGEAHEASERRRLARTIAPQQGDELAFADLEAHAVENVALAVKCLQAFRLERLHAAFPR